MDPEAPKILERTGSVCVTVTVAVKDAAHREDPLEQRSLAFSKAASDFLATLPPGSIRVRYRYRFSPVVLLDVGDAGTLAAISASNAVEALGLDATGSGALNQSRKLIHADEVYTQGIQGTGRVAAVIDSGVDSEHPDLADAVIQKHHFLKAGADVGDGDGALPLHAHGTNVAGIVASRGTVAPRGIAPGASIISVRVLDSGNRGFLSDWAAGVEYVVGIQMAGTTRVDAINMSLVSDAPFPDLCDSSFTAFSAACAAAREAGIAVFASSGNTGKTTELTSPACLSSVISVGSVLDTLPDQISFFTSRNVLLDLLAPGEPITSTGPGGGTSTFSGTSQACPHAVGVACLLRGISPEMPPDVIEKVLKATGAPVLDSPGSGLTFPRIDALAAVDAALKPGDCNENGVSDYIDIVISRASMDLNSNGIPDECDPPLPQASFRRGDSNGNGDVDLSDAIKTFIYLFAGGAVACEDALDSDDSGKLDITDGIHTLLYLFQGGDPIPSPGPDACGDDPTRDALGCAVYAKCGE